VQAMSGLTFGSVTGVTGLIDRIIENPSAANT